LKLLDFDSETLPVEIVKDSSCLIASEKFVSVFKKVYLTSFILGAM